MLTAEKLHELFEYWDGNLYRKVARKMSPIGKRVGWVSNTGYLSVEIDHKSYSVHRLVWLMHHGVLPEFLDHINGNKLDNRIENLRPATKSQNNQNKRLYSNNTSGVKGVCWHKRIKKWQVNVRVNGKQKSFGFFDDIELAELVASEARNKLHGQFARHQ